jgi:hypothetical protein
VFKVLAAKFKMPLISSFFGRRLFLYYSFFLYAGKKSAEVLRKPYSAPIWETPNIKCMYYSCIFGDRFIEKDGGLRTHNPSAEEVRGMEVFFLLRESEL